MIIKNRLFSTSCLSMTMTVHKRCVIFGHT